MHGVNKVESPQESATQQLAHLLKAAGDGLRLGILRALSRDSFGVLELSHIFDCTQSGMSHHLKVLAGAGLVSTRRDGNSIFYRRNNTSAEGELGQLFTALHQSIDELSLSADRQQRIRDIHRQRSRTSRDFFANVGANLKQQQDLIAAFDVYGGQVAALLKQAPLPGHQSVLEVGPGAGEFLPLLAKRFKSVVALDNAAAMLEKARSQCEESGLGNVSFELADTGYCHKHPSEFDCAVINMVLHHTPSPQQIFRDLGIALREAGVLLVCELCHHDQEWTREACGDLWLGFEAEELAQWAGANQFFEGQSSYFALRNGFQIQVREFIKQS